MFDFDSAGDRHFLVYERAGHRRGIAQVLEGFAGIAAHQDAPERVLRLIARVCARRQRGRGRNRTY